MKKRTFRVTMLAVLAVLCFTLSAFALQTGDVSGDGEIGADDARLALRMSVGLEECVKGSEKFKAADVNSNGAVEADDARSILRASVGLEYFRGEKLSSSEIYKAASAYTYEVKASDSEYISTGTGFAISADGKIVTNFHVIDGMYSILVTDSEGNEYTVTKVLAYSRDMDLAVLKINAKTTAAQLNNSAYAVGDVVYALGSSQGYTGTFSDGIISTVGRYDADFNKYVSYIQTTAPVTHGNSGGPLIDAYGWVIGINTWTRTDGQNLNFAIPVTYLSKLDYSAPLTVEKFYEYCVKANYGVYLSPDEISLCPCGTAYALVYPIGPADASVIYEVSDENALSCEWGDWFEIDGSYYLPLYLFAQNKTGTFKVKIYIENYPDVCDTITVKISKSGEKYYYSGLVPDIGAYTSVPATLAEIDYENDLFSVYYDAADVYNAGYPYLDDYIDACTKCLNASGFYLTEKEEYADGILYYFENYEYDYLISLIAMYTDDGYSIAYYYITM